MSQAIDGGSGDDTVSGASEASGSGGWESRSGTSETDMPAGGDGNDLICSGFTSKGGTPGDRTGDDTLTGGSADDTQFGGTGRDIFILTAGGGSDRIGDFEARDLDSDRLAEDRLDVSPQHRAVLSGPDMQARFGRAEALAPAQAMILRPDCPVQRRIEAIADVALLLDRHEVIFVARARVERFRPGPIVMAGPGADARADPQALPGASR